jgi:hypothetical protein
MSKHMSFLIQPLCVVVKQATTQGQRGKKISDEVREVHIRICIERQIT